MCNNNNTDKTCVAIIRDFDVSNGMYDDHNGIANGGIAGSNDDDDSDKINNNNLNFNSVLKRTSRRMSKSMSYIAGLGYTSPNTVEQNQRFSCFCCAHEEHLSQTLRSSERRKSWRKWLPQPLRKLSQSKVDKPTPEKMLVKKSSEKNMRLPHKHAEEEIGGGSTSSVGQLPHFATTSSQAHNTSATQDYEAEDEAGLELPPPMKPINEPHLMANGPPAFNKDLKENAANLASTGKMDGNTAIDLSEIEQIVKEKTEQHEEKSKFLKPNFEHNNASAGNESNTTNNTNGRSIGGGELNLSYGNNEHNAGDNNDENHTEPIDTKASALRKRQCALAELISTEESYVQDLSKIVNGYMAEAENPNSDIPLPDDLKGGKIDLVFNNIKDIYRWHRDCFLKALQSCQKSPADLGPLVKRYEHKFQMYYPYCRNKPLSEHIIGEHYQYFEAIRQKLGHRLDISSLTIKPMQRITKYELILKEITKQTERAGLIEDVSNLKESCLVMKEIVKNIDHAMVMRSLQNFDGKLTAQGKLLLQGLLTCVEDTSKSNERNTSSVTQKPRELQVFFFEQIIIFADIEKKKGPFSSPTFNYRSHIQVNKMSFNVLPNNRFSLKSTDPNRPELNMICCAATVDQNNEWVEKLNGTFKIQHDLLLALTSPIQHQNKLTKES